MPQSSAYRRGRSMIFVTDASGKATYLSREWGDLTGQSLADAVDYGWSKVVHPDDLAIIRELVSTAVTQHRAFSVHYRLLSPDGRATWVAAGAVPSFGPPGRTFLGFLGSITPLVDAPREGPTAGGSLGRFSPPEPEPGSTLERVADHLIMAHALIVQDGGTCALTPVEAALHEVGRELARVAEAERDRAVIH